MTALIHIVNLSHTYNPTGDRPVHALRNVDLTINQGEYVAIVGANGSGKSTLARHLNGLLLPTEGDVLVNGWNTKAQEHLADIRATVGMVFQSPDNQIVATIVEEDVAFGPENRNLERAEIVRRVERSLTAVEMWEYRHRAPHMLSGGQKQRICIAGVLALEPTVLVLDEATAMLDPDGRNDVLSIAQRLHRKEGVTIIAITHFMQEVVHADRVIVMADGAIVLQGTPREIFRQADRLRALQLDIPPVTEVALALHDQDATFPSDLLTIDELVEAVAARMTVPSSTAMPPPQPAHTREQDERTQPLIEVIDLIHYYMRDTPMEVQALYELDLTIHQGDIVGILGHTGSGKSTVIQHFNGLLRPHGGLVRVFDEELRERGADLSALRQRVGLVFQFPETQLFERYVGDDIAFGPRNLNLSREAVRERVRQAMEAVGLDFEAFKDRMTFGLSGGQLRRVALAGVLALQPELLVLDEPTAGLDPQGRRQLLDHLRTLHAAGMTLVIVSHNMEELAAICNRLYVLERGRTVMAGTPAEIFAQGDALEALHLGVPDVTVVINKLVRRGVLPVDAVAYTVKQVTDLLSKGT